jgi:hypothetical protein
MTSIKTVFKRNFSMTLLPMGFVYSKQINSFIRLVNGEIFQFISLQTMPMKVQGYKEFAINAGIKSIYSESFEKVHLNFCVVPLAHFVGVDSGDKNLWEKLYSISYNENTVEEAVIYAFKKTLEIAVPKLDEINDYNAAITFYIKYRIDMIRYAENFSTDSLLLIVANNHNDFMSEFQKALDRNVELIAKGESGETHEKAYRNLYHGLVETIAGSRDKVYNDPELYARAIAEMERRKPVNLEVIRSYGLDV